MNTPKQTDLSKKLSEALETFLTSAWEISGLTDLLTDEEQKAFYTRYPFHKSFNELCFDINAWIESAQESINQLRKP